MNSLSYYDFFDGYSTYRGIAGVTTFFAFLSLAAVVMLIIGMWKVFEKAGKPGWHALIPFLNIYDLFVISWERKKGVATIILISVSFGLAIISAIILAVFFISRGAGIVYMSASDIIDLLRYSDTASVLLILSVLLIFASWVCSIISAIFVLIAFIKLGKSFGKSGGFLVGMFFVPYVFVPILAFGHAVYYGPNGEGYNPNAYNPNQGGYNQQNYQNQGGYNQQNYQNQGYNQTNYQNQGYNQQSYNQGYNQQNMNQGGYNQQAGPAQGQRFCNACGTPLAPGAKFCNKCGKPV